MKIISGGQTGADRAGLDVAISLGLEYGGNLPKGRLTEEGPLDAKYSKMTELSSSSYPVRTKKNIVESDATLVFTMGKVGRGTALTIKTAKKCKKPCLHVDYMAQKDKDIEKEINRWLKENKPNVINIAGSRESAAKGIYKKVYETLVDIF
jgi:hypothetical protein